MGRQERNQELSTEELLAQWDAARWSVACREMQIRIGRGCFEAAHRALSHFCRDTQPDFATLESHVAAVFPVRIANMLEEAGFATLRSVDNELDATLMAIPNFGDVCIGICRKTIAAVRAGTVPEICPDDDLGELIDSEHSYHLRTFNNFTHLRNSVITNQPREQMVMSTSEQIKQAMSLLMNDTGQALAVINKEIGDHEAEIIRLNKMRKFLGGEPTKTYKPRESGELTPKLAKIEERAFAYVSDSAPSKISISDLAEAISASRLAVGMAVARSKRLTKDGKTVVLMGAV